MYNAIFLSDIHLGTSVCQADKLLLFLKSLETPTGYNVKTVYLVGDIIDFTAMAVKNKWDSSHTTVIQKFLRMSRKGVKFYYIQGNHDYILENVLDWTFGDIQIAERVIHETKTGERYLVLHGHQFDGFVHTMPWLYWLGDTAYSLSIFINKWFNKGRKLFGLNYWSLSYYLKTKVKSTIKFINDFNKIIVEECKNTKDISGIIYGHTHCPSDSMIDEYRIMNIGCSTEITTCIVEHEDGRLELIHYQNKDSE